MRSLFILSVLCLMTACAALTHESPNPTPVVSPPAQSLIKCDEALPEFTTGSNMGDLRRAYYDLLDLYDLCSIRHNAISSWWENYLESLNASMDRS